MFQPRPWPTCVAVSLRIGKWFNVQQYPLSQLLLELTDLQTIPDADWNAVPLGCCSKTEAILCKTKCCIWNNNISSLIISVQKAAQVFRFLTVPDPVGAQGSVVVYQL